MTLCQYHASVIVLGEMNTIICFIELVYLFV